MQFNSVVISQLLLTLASVSMGASTAFKEHHQHQRATLEKRAATCKFPTDKNLVAVTPNSKNGGWALSPDQECTAGSYCPYACPPGQLMAQWDPSATSYSYPESERGGIYCNENGEIEVPFSSKDWCYSGKGTLQASNKAGSNVAFCQTVLPGNEAMLIPTNVDGGSTEDLAIPGTEYWASTAAHYYINPPGVSTEDGCVWGSTANPYGNWSPYVAGGNVDDSGNSFVKIGWNPIYLEDATPFKNTKPDFGVKITCSEGQCNGLPCEIDPSKNGVNEVSSSQSSNGAGGANSCVVTGSKGAKVTIEVFSTGGVSKREEVPIQSLLSNKDSSSNHTNSTPVVDPINSGVSLSAASPMVVMTLVALTTFLFC
ncbi:hypothetical protein LJB42_000980 [Komagataella kurtzmanii]|nr:hypothetical protein LJB42_000980 [Komagataella kurtzmanii]